MKELTIKEFLEIQEMWLPPMLSDTYVAIAKFFSQYAQNDLYFVDCSEGVCDDFIENSSIYSRFGIFFQMGDTVSLSETNSVGIENKEYILYVENDLEDAVGKFHEKYGDAEYRFVVVLDETVLPSVIEDCHGLSLMNVVERKHVMKKERSKAFKYVNIYDIFADIVQENRISAMCTKILAAKDQIRRRYADEMKSIPSEFSGVVLYYDDSAAVGVDAMLRRAKHAQYLNLAASLTYEGINFDIGIGDREEFLISVREILSPRFMLLKDYLYKITHPLSVAMSLTSDVSYLCLLDKQVYGGRYRPLDPELVLYELQVDDKWRLQERFLQRVVCRYSSIEIADVVSEFELESKEVHFMQAGAASISRRAAIDNHNRLNGIIAELSEVASAERIVSEEAALNFTNTMFYKRDGKNYIGIMPVLPKLLYKYLYIPFSGDRVFPQVLDVFNYDRLFDTRVIADCGKIINRYKDYVFEEQRHFALPEYVNGHILKCLPVTSDLLSQECGLNVLGAGVWSVQSQNGRNEYLGEYLNWFERRVLYKQGCLTFWGGAHPMFSTTLRLSYDIWR